MTKEARHHERRRTVIGAQIIFNHKMSTLECMIGNISSAGAKLVVSETVALPDEFEVYIPQQERTFRARLRWRSPDSVGVEFLRDEVRSAPMTGEDPVARIQELESENDLLRRRVLELMVKLEKAGGNNIREVA